MIDTIHFEIIGSHYIDVFNHLVKHANQKQKYGLVSKSSFIYYNQIEFENKSIGKFNGFYTIPSSNYNINFSYDREKDKIMFNLSIPKYYQGNNIYQYIVDSHYPEFNIQLYKYENQLEYIHKLLLKFLNDFNNAVCNGKINIYDIIIKRIDYCFNAIFKTEKELSIYFEAIKRIKKTYERGNSNIHRNYQSAIFYVGKGYSLKIYKKHDEYIKNDYRELSKIDNNKANILHEYTKKVLRYEITYRNEYLSLFYNKHIYRRKCINWQIIKRQYKQGTLKYNEVNMYEKAMNKRKNFYIYLPPEQNKSNNITDNVILTDAIFSKKLMIELGYNFIKLMSHFSITKYEYEMKIEGVENKEKISFKRAMQLTKKYNLDELLKYGKISRATYYRYKTLLEKYNQKNNMLKMQIDVKYDYEKYITDFNSLGLLTFTC